MSAACHDPSIRLNNGKGRMRALWWYAVLIAVASMIPAVISYFMNSQAATTGVSDRDAPVLASWTLLYVSWLANYRFAALSGPLSYLAAYTGLFAAHGLFMERLGTPIGIALAQRLGALGIGNPQAAALATYLHHVGVGVVTLLAASVVISVIKSATSGQQRPHG